MIPLRFGLAAGAALLAAGAVAASPATGAPSAPATLKNINATANVLSRRFMDALGPGAKAEARLRAFVSPAFIIQRNDGTRSGWPAYLTTHPIITDYAFTIARAQYRAPVMTVVVAISRTTQLVNGQPVVSAPAANLASYVWTPRGWQITAYASFDAVPT